MSLAFGLRQANQGRRVVVVTSHPLSELAVSISLHGLKEKCPFAAANLFVVHIDAKEILGNKVRQQIPSAWLANAVLSSRIYQSLIEVAPGLKELAFLARLHQLAEHQSQEEGGESYDLLIWDAPATGHFLQTLRVSRNFDAYLSGPFALIGKDLTRFFSDPAKIRIFPVTTLEEMAIEETVELCEKLAADLGTKPAGVICNLASPLLAEPPSTLENLYQQYAGDERCGDLGYVLDRHAIERNLFHKLQDSVDAGCRIVRRKPNWASDLELLLDLSRQLGEDLASDTP